MLFLYSEGAWQQGNSKVHDEGKRRVVLDVPWMTLHDLRRTMARAPPTPAVLVTSVSAVPTVWPPPLHPCLRVGGANKTKPSAWALA